MPNDRKSTVSLICMNKMVVRNFSNYDGIKFISHSIKLWRKVIEQKLGKMTRISENQLM